jgi:hypothetical protein
MCEWRGAAARMLVDTITKAAITNNARIALRLY